MTEIEKTIKEISTNGLDEFVEYKRKQVVINALEKQIPMKVVEERNIYLCPNCGANAETDCGDDMLDYRLNYCDNCGQKLDWSDYE